jgi:hypothetical protein
MDEKRDRSNEPILISNATALPSAPFSLDSGMVAHPKERAAVIVSG